MKRVVGRVEVQSARRPAVPGDRGGRDHSAQRVDVEAPPAVCDVVTNDAVPDAQRLLALDLESPGQDPSSSARDVFLYGAVLDGEPPRYLLDPPAGFPCAVADRQITERDRVQDLLPTGTTTPGPATGRRRQTVQVQEEHGALSIAVNDGQFRPRAAQLEVLLDDRYVLHKGFRAQLDDISRSRAVHRLLDRAEIASAGADGPGGSVRRHSTAEDQHEHGRGESMHGGLLYSRRRIRSAVAISASAASTAIFLPRWASTW